MFTVLFFIYIYIFHQEHQQQHQLNRCPFKDENAFLKAKIKFLEDKCKDIESERDFLRSSLTNGKLFYL